MAKGIISGIYKITNKVNLKVYIGQSNNIYQRWRSHRSSLKSGYRENSHLVNAWRKYGEPNFDFEILEKCSLEELDEKERYWISNYESCDREKGYNKESGGNLNKILSIETRHKISKNHADVCGINNSYYGKKHSDETRKKIKDNHADFKGENHPNTKLTSKNVLAIKDMLSEKKPIKYIADAFNVGISCVNHIKNGSSWSEVTGIVYLGIK